MSHHLSRLFKEIVLWSSGFLFFSITCIILFCIGVNYYNGSIFCASTATPWGVITAMFIHLNLPHLVGNLINLFIILGWVLFVFKQFDLPLLSGRALLAISLGSSCLAISAWLIFSFIVGYNGRLAGASGVVCGLLGFLGAQLFFLIISGRYPQKIFGFILWMILFIPYSASFLNNGNVFGHAFSLLSGLILGILLLKKRVKACSTT